MYDSSTIISEPYLLQNLIVKVVEPKSQLPLMQTRIELKSAALRSTTRHLSGYTVVLFHATDCWAQYPKSKDRHNMRDHPTIMAVP